LTEESNNLKADIRRLEERIDSLRFVVIILTIVVSLLTIHVLFQLTPLDLLLPLFAVVGFLFLCIYLLSTSCAKDSGAPAGT